MSVNPSRMHDENHGDSFAKIILDGKIDPRSSAPACKHFMSDSDAREPTTKRRSATCEVGGTSGLALDESLAIPQTRIPLKTLPNGRVEDIATLRSRNNDAKGYDDTSEVSRKMVIRRDPGKARRNLLARPAPCKESAGPIRFPCGPQPLSLPCSEVVWVWIKIIRRGTKEAEILKRVRRYQDLSRHVVNVKDIIDFPDGIIISMELAEGDLGQMLSYSKDERPVDFQTRLGLFEKLLDLADGLKLLHEGMGKKCVVHGDFRDQNILVFRDGDGEMILKISDFGISFYGDRRSSGVAEFANPKQGSECDSRPPEGFCQIHKDDRANVSCAYDVYAFGVWLCLRLAWLWGGPTEYEKFSTMRTNTPFWESGVNTWFFSIYPESRHPSAEQTVVDPNNLRVRLDTNAGPINVVIQPNRGVRRYFESIRDSEGSEGEKEFIWAAFLDIEKHCLSPNPQRRSSIGVVVKSLQSLTSWHRAKK